uniref:Prephenate dehydratase domain-containing protein n=1 Tax=Nelumbo nucifera TaxID=4432 RepID=A0A822XWU8_NELNU|nr:TPA_asm: hypothetical protein HUJ06_024949 [Nelumbo nucifera]
MHGSQVSVAYQGISGAYNEATTGKASPKCQVIPCDQFKVAWHFKQWSSGSPIRPSCLSRTRWGYTTPRPPLPARLAQSEGVPEPCHCYPQALSQCELTLNKMGLNVVQEAVDDMVGVAEFVATNNLRSTMAIASARAVELYGLEVLANGIQDDSSNPIIPRTDCPFKTNIVFAHDKGTSVLFKVLSAFAFRYISLMKIESQPHRNCPIRLVDDANMGTTKHFEYMFYMDSEASMVEVRAQNALAEVQKHDA